MTIAEQIVIRKLQAIVNGGKNWTDVLNAWLVLARKRFYYNEQLR